jgi:hypothetical protein
MDIGIGLPNAVPGVDRDSLLEFARRADQRAKVQEYVQAFEDVGCGELVFIPASKDPAQVDLLADAVGLGK